MSIIGTYNGVSIVGLPCDTVAGCPKPTSIEWDAQEIVAATTGITTGQQQIFDWQASYMEGVVSLPPMSRVNADAWSSFIQQCRGPVNAFLLGDPKAAIAKGTPTGSPVISGSNQAFYSLVTRGWTASTAILKTGDYISIGYRLYRILNAATSDASGDATLAIWPNLRNTPSDATTDGTPIGVANCKGLFRLKLASGNKFSTNIGIYGVSGIQIREAI